ncbi:type I Iterative Polyketide synthase (PKS) [Aspergillus tubingensis]|nr:type I Iterative Polyketide synthase (PKS) [Aspergillus tubingensis]
MSPACDTVDMDGSPPPTETQALEPIAIIGYSCRLPGQVSSPSDLWELCTRGRSGWTPIPKDRWSVEAFHHPNASKPGTSNQAGGYFLGDISRFDAPFFNVSAQEAISMDPQQRFLLECTYEAMESAGISREYMAGRSIGVFIGANWPDYETNNIRDTETAPMFQATGGYPALQSNRISYMFDLKGPSLTVDTACSSSLVALHSAVQSLRSGECTEALVGGCHLLLTPENSITMSMQQLLNDEGKSFAFEERGNSGFARGEGAGIIMLKSLSAALRNRDPIRALIAHSGVNQDGKTRGITCPNGVAQEELIRRVYKEANLNPADCGFVEAHGTGTAVGDPIEATAIQAVFGKGRNARNPLYIGSVKTNVGHLEGASGIISVIKSAMMLERELILPNAGYKNPNPKIPFAEWHMKVVNRTRPWPRGKRYISVSNYGFGGTNAHVVLQKAPSQVPQEEVTSTKDKEGKRRLLLISAHDRDALRTRCKEYCIYFEQRPEVFENTLFGNFAYTVGSKRSHLPYRIALSATSLDDAGVQLAQMKINPVRAIGGDGPSVSFVFTGQGAQWAQMGMPLMDEFPVFAAAIHRADKHLSEGLGAEFSLREELLQTDTNSRVNMPYISQPACTALQIALVDLLRSWGIQPVSVVGHSSGEIAAAYAAGIFDLEGALTLAYRRGQMTELLKSQYPDLKGTMMAVGTSVEAIQPMLKTLYSGYATVACVNSPSSVTISGDVPAIEELQGILEEKKIFNRRLIIDVAYHSDHMKKVSEAYFSAIASVQPSGAATATFFSSVVGDVSDPTDLSPSYWVQNLTSPVLFANALGKMCGVGSKPNLMVEVGPHSALKGPILDTLKALGSSVASEVAYVPTVVRKVDPSQSLLDAAGAVYVRGGTLNINEINFPFSGTGTCNVLDDLPRYPWQHDTVFWHHSRISEKHRFRDGQRNDILGTEAFYSNDLEPTWRNIVRLDDIPWLRDHRMQGMIVYPIAGYISMAIEAARTRAQKYSTVAAESQFELREVSVGAALVLTDDLDTEITITLRPYAEGTRGASNAWDEFHIRSWNSKRHWIDHCTGLVKVNPNKKYRKHNPVVDVVDKAERAFAKKSSEVLEAATYEIDTENMYKVLSDVGATYGMAFQGFRNCFSGPHHSRADLYVCDTKSLMPKHYEAPVVIHPTLLDTLLHLTWPILGKGRMDLETLYVPTVIKSLVIDGNIPSTGHHFPARCMGGSGRARPEPTKFDLWMTPADSSEVLINMEGLVMTPINDTGCDNKVARDLCYQLQWKPLSKVEQVTTGEAIQTKQPNGHSKPHAIEHVNGYGHGIHCHHNKPQDDILIVKFGDCALAAEQVQEVISTKAIRWSTSISSLSDCNAKQKLQHVIILQTAVETLRDLTEADFANVQQILLSSTNLIWVYRDDTPDSQMIVGLIRSLRSETDAKVATLGLSAEDLERPAGPILAAMKALWPTEESFSPCTDFEFKTKNGELMVPRIINDNALDAFVGKETSDDLTLETQPFVQPGRRFKLEIGSHSALDTLYFTDDDVKALADDEIEIEVHATGLNFKDVAVTMGQLTQPYIGIECSGVVTSVGKKVTNLMIGERVMALPLGAYSTFARCKATSATAIPENLSFEVAASVPVVFCTAYYALYELARLQHGVGEKVLIHAAAGGVGQAAIMLAQIASAEIYATVGSAEKKSLLISKYGLRADHIFYSRDASFGRSIRELTCGGVDIVLNSLAGDLLRESWECLAPFGRFIEIGKADITKNTRLDMLPFENNLSFHSVDLTKVAAYRPRLMHQLLDKVSWLLDKGFIRSVFPLSVCPIAEIEGAFRALQTGKSMGKTVVVPRQGDQVRAVVAKTRDDILMADATYVVIGGTGGLGRSIARWMSQKGARNIVLASRRGIVDIPVQTLIDALRPSGTNIVVKACDVSNRTSVDAMLKDLENLPPIRGVIHGAMVLRDMIFENMHFADFQAVTDSKVTGAWNLHHALISHPLDFFVALSSVSGVVGNKGQAAYAAANVFLDGFMEWRRSQGLPGTSLALTAVRDAGYLSTVDAARREEVLRTIGTEGMTESEVLALLAAVVTGDLAHQAITGLASSTPQPLWPQDAKFELLTPKTRGGEEDVTDEGISQPLHVQLTNAASKEEKVRVCYEALAAKLAQVLVLNPEDIEPSLSVSALGLDSLVAIELRSWIAREARANVQVLELLSTGTLGAVAELIVSKSGI